MIWLYRLTVIPLAAILLPFIGPFIPKVRQGLKLRAKLVRPPKFSTNPIWIHSASGEFEYAKSVIREIKQSSPEIPIVVTYFSPSYADAIAKFAGVDFVTPLPLDLPGPCRTFIKRFHPRALLIARTDLWPEMLYQTRVAGIPIQLFSSTQKKGLKGFLKIWRMNMVDAIDCVTETDKKNLEIASVRPQIFVSGDTRYDQVAYRLQNRKDLPPTFSPQRPCLVAGSTWPEDEVVLLNALGPVLQSKRLQLILVPHEPTKSHIASLVAQLEANNLSHSLSSKREDWTDKAVLIVDEMGILAELYSLADFAFIGGSYKAKVHSVMEALGAGCQTFVGPFIDNNREALEFKELSFAHTPVVTSCATAEQLQAEVEAALALPEAARKAFQEGLEQEFKACQGASHRLIERLSNLGLLK